MDPDSYKSIAHETLGEFKDRGSKFIAYLFPIKNVEGFEKRLKELKKEHLKSRHHCYAYRIGIEGEPFRINDDGEPSGTAGKPIFGQLLKTELSDVACIVVRYFGGVKLGTSGLIQAYKGAAQEAIEHAEIIEKTITIEISISFSYEHLGKIMSCLKQMDIEDIQKDFTEEATLRFLIPKSKVEETKNSFLAKMLNRSISDIIGDEKIPGISIKL